MIEDLMILSLRFYRFRICRLEKASDNQLALAVDEGVCHVLFSRKTVRSLQWLDPETSQTSYSIYICHKEPKEAYMLSDNICMMPGLLYRA